MRLGLTRWSVLAVALTAAVAAHAAEMVVAAGENADTGSRSVRVPAGTAVGVIDTGSGSIELGAGSSVRGKIDSGSGSVDFNGVTVEGPIDTGSGDISLVDCQLRDDLRTTRGEVKLEGSTRVDGDLIIRKSKCWGICWGDDQPTRVIIGAGASVAGEIRSERETELWVHETARIGKVSGAEVKRFSGERP
jgi:hypothetical protein